MTGLGLKRYLGRLQVRLEFAENELKNAKDNLKWKMDFHNGGEDSHGADNIARAFSRVADAYRSIKATVDDINEVERLIEEEREFAENVKKKLNDGNCASCKVMLFEEDPIISFEGRNYCGHECQERGPQ